MKDKIFCISMQRTGTSSIGDFFESNGLRRVGHQLSDQLLWSRKWFEGDYESIFSDEKFINAEILEDDPFWYPDFFKVIFHRFPEAKFVFLYRDSDSWFKSMITHSNGHSLGMTDVHSKIYSREADLFWLRNNIEDYNEKRRQGMVLYDKAEHYKMIYEVYKSNVVNFFKDKNAKRYFISDLKSPTLWKDLADWSDIEIDDSNDVFHAHKTKRNMKQADLLAPRKI